MKYDESEQIPYGMLERISKRLEEHAGRRKKSRKLKIITVAALLAMILPLTVFSVTRMDFNWIQSIKIAEENGKTIILNKTFEYENHKIKFENAVWEDFALLISYSIPDWADGKEYIPSEVSLADENGRPLGKGKISGTEYDGKGSGILRFGLEDLDLKKENLILQIHTLTGPDINNSGNSYEITLDKNLKDKGKADVNYQFDTIYGTLKFIAARYENNKLSFDYSFDPTPEVKKLIQPDSEKYIRVMHGLFPKIYLKDNQNNVVQMGGRLSNPGSTEGEIFFSVDAGKLDYPLHMGFVYNESIVNWELPIQIKNPDSQLIKVNKTFKIGGGKLKINSLSLGSASTYLDYEFKPSEKEGLVIRAEPHISMVIDGQRYPGSLDTNNRVGKVIFKYPLEREMLKKAVFVISGATRTVSHDQSIPIDESNINKEYDLEGAGLKVTKMEIKDGHTNIDMEVSRGKRKYYDFDFYIEAKDGPIEYSLTAKREYPDPDFEKKIMENSLLLKQSDVANNTIKSSIKINGEYKKVELKMRDLIYIDVCRKEFKVK